MHKHPLDAFESWNTDKQIIIIISLLRAGRWGEATRLHRLQQSQGDVVIPTEAYVACGEICMLREHYSDAVESFIRAGNTVLLQKLGDVCVQVSQNKYAILAFKAAGAYDKLMSLGRECVKTKDYSNALDAFKECRDKGELENLGDKAFSLWRKDPSNKDMFHFGYLAKSAFFHAGAVHKMVQVGKMAIGINNDLAFTALEEANASPYLIELGYAQLKDGNWEGASKSFAYAGACDQLFECFQIGIQEVPVEQVFYSVFRMWKVDVPHERCQAFAISLLQKDDSELDSKAFDILKSL